MIKTYVEYNSQNEIYFHHSVSTFEEHKTFIRKPETHLQCEILFLLSGKVTYKIDGDSYEVHPGEMILLNMYELHTMYSDPSEPYERIVLQFSPNLIPKLIGFDPLEPFSSSRIFQRILPREFVQKSKLPAILTSIKRDCQKADKFTDLKIVSSILSFLEELNQTLEKFKKNFHEKSNFSNVADKFSKLCTNYINENISQKLTAKDIAQHIHVCESHLHHMFHKEMGMSIHTYILNQKMQTAAIMLNAGKSPQEVSKALGYEYYSTFFNNFQSFFGYTPNQHERYQHLVLAKPTQEGLTIPERIKQNTK